MHFLWQCNLLFMLFSIFNLLRAVYLRYLPMDTLFMSIISASLYSSNRHKSNHFYTTASQSSDFCCVELWCLAICNVPQLHTTQSAPLAHTTAITCYNCSTVITSTLITSVNDTIMRFLKFIEITAYSLPNSVVHLLVRTKK